ncbi:probable E3 ubiquitin-protein ligase bre1 [Vanessa cardui]|uniref:probable E3 ubiquitin-protein ligase bre1 n=1 Tax=Vanessa cardui TaxID=171605 RepID=UPI001F13ECFB|nr:probable E3 ubiquitin-protein ligase bre1 [Vanessa cardui]
MRKKVKKIKQEISKSQQLLQKKRKRKLTDRTQFTSVLDEQKPQKITQLSSFSNFDMFDDLYGNFDSLSTSINYTLPERENTTCKKMPPRIDDDVIILDDDDEPEISLKKSKQDNTVSYTSHLPLLKINEADNFHKDNSDDELSTYNESTSNSIEHNVFNNQASTANNSHDTKTTLCTEQVEFPNPHDFCPIPSTSKDDETILKNEERFKEYMSLCTSNRKATVSPEIKKEHCEPMVTDDTNAQQLTEKMENKDEDTNTSKINCPIVIDTIDLSCVDDVIAENDSILNRIRNRQSRIGKLIEVLKTEPEDVTPVLNNSSNNAITVPVNDRTTKMELSDLSPPHATIDEVPHSIQNIEIIQNVPHPSQESSVEQTNSLSRDVEILIPNSGMTNNNEQDLLQTQILNVLPINMPVDQPTSPTSLSYDTQISNSNESVIIINDNVNVTCNCSQNIRNKSLSQTSNTDQSSEQNVNQEEKKTSFISARCPICMESLAEKVIASTLCGHLFCMSCIKAALKYPPKKCPTCRQKITGIGYHQIFLF